MVLHKTLEPEEVLKAVAYFIRSEFPDEFDATITCKFTDDDGTVEIFVVKKTDDKYLC